MKDHPDYPETDQCIRMNYLDMTLWEEKDGDLHLTKFATFDIQGWFPIRLLNLTIGVAFTDIFKGLVQMFNHLKSLD